MADGASIDIARPRPVAGAWEAWPDAVQWPWRLPRGRIAVGITDVWVDLGARNATGERVLELPADGPPRASSGRGGRVGRRWDAMPPARWPCSGACGRAWTAGRRRAGPTPVQRTDAEAGHRNAVRAWTRTITPTRMCATRRGPLWMRRARRTVQFGPRRTENFACLPNAERARPTKQERGDCFRVERRRHTINCGRCW